MQGGLHSEGGMGGHGRVAGKKEKIEKNLSKDLSNAIVSYII